MAPESHWRTLLDALPDPACVLASDGVILTVNTAWVDFARENGGDPAAIGPGADYLAACDTEQRALEDHDPAMMSVAAIVGTLGDVLAGRLTQTVCEYPCHAPRIRRWFLMRARGFVAEGERRVLVTHTDITLSRRSWEDRREHLELFEALDHQPGIALWEMSVRTGRVSHSAGLLHLLGHPEDGRRTETPAWHHLVARVERRRLIDWVGRARQGVIAEHTFADEVRLRHYAGRPLWVLAVARVVAWSQEGRPTRLAGMVIDVSSRKRLEHLLARERRVYERLSLIASNTDNLVIFTDRAGRTTWVNEGFSRATGFTLQEIRGRKPGELLQGPGTDPATIGLIRAAVAQGEPITVKLLNYTRDRRPYEVQAEIKPIDGADGTVTGFMAVQTDITEQSERARELQRLYAQLHALTELVPGGLYQYRISPDGDHVMDYCSDQFRELHGLGEDADADADVLRQLQRRIPADDYATLIRQVEGVVGTSEALAYDYRILLPDGGERHISGVSRSVVHVDGSTVFHGFVRDVTERRVMERRLRESHQRFADIARLTHEVLWETDVDARLSFVSDNVEEILGYRPADLVGETFLVLCDPEARARIQENMRGVRGRRQEFRDYHLPALDAAGHRRWLEFSGTPLIGADGALAGYRGSFSDVTSRVETARKLRRSEERFERAVRGSTDGLWDYAFASRTIWVSARMDELLGRRPEQALAGHRPLLSLLRRLHPGHHAMVRAAWRAHHDSGHPFDVVVQLRVGDFDWRWFRIRGELSRQETGDVVRMSGSLSDVHEWQQARERLEWQVLHDPLTGLSNRELFMDRVGQLIYRQREESALRAAVFAMDFDRFKQVNDVHGHAVGDELLRRIGQRLREQTSGGDIACRFGGDEFAVLLPGVGNAEEARVRAERLHAALGQPYALQGGLEIVCSASIGVLYLEAARYDSADAVLRDADAAMYQAKASGGRVQFFDSRLRERMARMAHLEQGLRQCVANRELMLRYQPVISLETGQISLLEALVRWQRPGETELVRPDEFIPLAEETGLIVGIGRWIAEQACSDLVAMRAQEPAMSALRMAINVSRRELVEPDYVPWLQAMVKTHGLQPQDLMLEITETAFVDARYDITDTAKQLRDAGFLLALDDFGTGQSSLNSLQELPISVVKIDKKFIRELTSRQSFMAIVHAIVTLGHYLELQVIAEGVESETEVAALQGMDCAMGQGFFFSRPVVWEDIIGLARSRQVRAVPDAQGCLANWPRERALTAGGYAHG